QRTRRGRLLTMAHGGWAGTAGPLSATCIQSGFADDLDRFAGERQTPGDGLIENDPESVNIGSRRWSLRSPQFGRHVVGSASAYTRRLIGAAGQPEVGDHSTQMSGLVRAENDIVAFQIAVHDSASVCFRYSCT